MNLSARTDEVRKRKLFVKKDVAVYAALAVALCALFFSLVILPRKTESNGFCAYSDDKLLFTYYYASDKLVITEFGDGKISRDGDKIRITVYRDGAEFNELNVNREKKSVRVSDADCSKTKDCVHEPSISNSGAIYCAPHKLKIIPLSAKPSSPVTG